MTYNEVFEQGGYFETSIEPIGHPIRINLGDIHMGWNLLLDITETNDHDSHVTMVKWELLEFAE